MTARLRCLFRRYALPVDDQAPHLGPSTAYRCDEARPTVEETELPEVRFDELEKKPKQEVETARRTSGALAPHQLLSADLGIGKLLAYILGKCAVGDVEQRKVDDADVAAGNIYVVVRVDADEASLVFPEKAHYAVGVPAAVPHPVAQEPVFAREAVAIVARVLHLGADPLRQFGRYPLVGIHRQDPGTRGEVNCDVLLFLMPGKRRFDEHLFSELPGDLQGLVPASRVDDHDLVDPAQRFETAAEISLLIVRNDGR